MKAYNPVRRFREKHGLSIREMAALLEISHTMVWKCEQRPKKTPTWIRLFCEDPMMPPEYLEERLRRARYTAMLVRGCAPGEAEERLENQGAPFRRWRMERKLSQQRAAEVLGIPVAMVIALDHGGDIPEDIQRRMR